MAAPGETTRPAATEPSTAKYIRMWCRTNVRLPSHQRLSSHSVPTKRASRAQRNSAPNPDSRCALEIRLGTSSRVSRNRKALARMRSRGLTASASANAATSAPMVTIWMRERGSGMMVSAPVGAERVEDQQPPDRPDGLRCAGGARFGPRAACRPRPVRPAAHRACMSPPISTTRPGAEGAARVLPVRRALPLPEVEHPARVVGDEAPRSRRRRCRASGCAARG